jgi:hypothetical protein
MVGCQNDRKKFICCFCGYSIDQFDILYLQIYLDPEDDASQCLYCHKDCLKSCIDTEIPMVFE